MMGTGGWSTQGLRGLEMLSAFIAFRSCIFPRSHGSAKGKGANPSDSLLAFLSQGQSLRDFSQPLRASHMPSLYIYFGGRGTSVEVRGHLAGICSLLPLCRF